MGRVITKATYDSVAMAFTVPQKAFRPGQTVRMTPYRDDSAYDDFVRRLYEVGLKLQFSHVDSDGVDVWEFVEKLR